MKSLRKEYVIHAQPKEVWYALTNSDALEAWGAGKTTMEDKVDGKFSIWDGEIYGDNIHVEPPIKLHQQWYIKGWKEPSKVTFQLAFRGEHDTLLILTHHNIPDDNYYDISKGWDDYYLGPLKEYVEKKVELV